jgi:hypothetical protein
VAFAIRPGGPKQVIVGAAPLAVLPEASILVKALDGARIRIAVVEVLDRLGDAGKS